MGLRFTCIILSLLIFISSSGIAINRHLCRMQLKDVALFIQPTACHEQLAERTSSCPFHQADNHLAQSTAKKEGKDCCSNDGSFHKLSTLVHPTDKVNKNLSVSDLVAITTSGLDWQVWHNFFSTFNYLHYKPPLLFRAIYLFIQCFRC